MTKLAILGAGNIAYAIASGLVDDDFPPGDVLAADPFPAQLEKFAALGMTTAPSNSDAASGADLVLIAVKPDVVAEVCQEVAGVAPGAVYVSVAAGITAGSLCEWLGSGKVVRCMPNTPALVQEGMMGLYATAGVSPADREFVESLFSPVGRTRWFAEESMIDVVTAVSGSGPAYFFLVMEAMQDAALDLGLTADEARLLVQQTALGAARMALASDDEVATLRSNVTSKGGTTHAAVTVLEENGLRETFANAMAAARQRSIELSGG